MTRTITISVSSALLILVLAFGGNVLAQTGDPNQGPLNALLKAVGVIQKQTSNIADSVAEAIGGLRVVHSELKTVAGSVAAGLDGESRILRELQALRHKIDNLEAGQRPAPSAHRLWVSPYWTNSLWGDDAIFQMPSAASVLNPGAIEAEFHCMFLDQNGFVVSGDMGTPDHAGPGMRSDCFSPTSPEFRSFNGWLIVTSDRPVLPYGWYVDAQGASTELRGVQAIQFYPVDCTNPADDTVSFACRFAKPAR